MSEQHDRKKLVKQYAPKHCRSCILISVYLKNDSYIPHCNHEYSDGSTDVLDCPLFKGKDYSVENIVEGDTRKW